MKSSKMKIVLAMFILAIVPSVTFAQNTNKSQSAKEKSENNFETIRRSQLWIESNNPAGLLFNDFSGISYIKGYFSKNDGGFVKYYESDDSYEFGVQSESFTKVKKVSMYGKIGYNSFRGENMTWSGLSNPDEFMINIADDRPAQKRKENYFIGGAVSFPITSALKGGFSLDYNASNLAKMRDLRHKNSTMDLNAKISLLYSVGSFNLGLSYWYQRFTDMVKYSKISDDAQIYYGYNFKGLFFGLKDVWDVDALHLNITSDAGDGLPFRNNYNGASAQVEYHCGNFRFLNEFTYRNRKGEIGIGNELLYNKSNGNIYEYTGKMSYGSADMNHYLRFRHKYIDENNNENVFTSNIINGESVVVQYGQSEVFKRRVNNIDAEYELDLGESKYSPKWSFIAGYNYLGRSSVSSMVLPYYFSQKINSNSAYLKLLKNIGFKSGMLDITLSFDYSNGYGNKLTEHVAEGVNAQPSESSKPQAFELLLNKEYEYFTTPKLGGLAGLRYSFFINKNNGKGGNLFIDASYKYINASNAIYATGKHASVALIAVGINF